jgi:hypothetical protein
MKRGLILLAWLAFVTAAMLCCALNSIGSLFFFIVLWLWWPPWRS